MTFVRRVERGLFGSGGYAESTRPRKVLGPGGLGLDRTKFVRRVERGFVCEWRIC